MGASISQRCSQRLHSMRFHGFSRRGRTVVSVSLQHVGGCSEASFGALNRWHACELRHDSRVASEHWPALSLQPAASRVCQSNTAFAACIDSMRRVRTGVCPQKTTRTLVLSMIPHSRLIHPDCCPKPIIATHAVWARRRSWSRVRTVANTCDDGRVAEPFGFRPHRSVRAAFPHTALPKGNPSQAKRGRTG